MYISCRLLKNAAKRVLTCKHRLRYSRERARQKKGAPSVDFAEYWTFKKSPKELARLESVNKALERMTRLYEQADLNEDNVRRRRLREGGGGDQQMVAKTETE